VEVAPIVNSVSAARLVLPAGKDAAPALEPILLTSRAPASSEAEKRILGYL